MTQLSAFIATSLDGFIADSVGSLEWLESAARPDEDYGYDAFLGGIDALAMGRGTYDHIAHLDPLPFDSRPVFVFTHHPPADRAGVTFWSHAPHDATAQWAAQGLARVYVDGGVLISSFLAAGLIDDLTITIAPTLLGNGLRLFNPGIARSTWQLTNTRNWQSGFAQLTYARSSPG